MSHPITQSPADAELPTPPQAIDSDTKPYWDAAARGHLVLPTCTECTRVFWYPRGICPYCGATAITWTPSPGAGTVYTFTAVHKSSGDWSQRTPYHVAYVLLDEGITVVSNLVRLHGAPAHIGMRVQALFERREATDSPILRFRPAS